MSLIVTKAGVFDTIQDKGRYGYQHLGINPAGCMDTFSSQLSNALLGKDLTAPVIELHFPASEISIKEDTILCLGGADFSAFIDSYPLPLHQPVAVKSGGVLRFSGVKTGARCYISFLQSFHLQQWLHNYSTNIKAAAGGFEGRKLMMGDVLLFEEAISIEHMLHAKPVHLLPWKAAEINEFDRTIEFIPGNEWDWLTRKSQAAFMNNSFTISSQSDRMGYRLIGEAMEVQINEQLISSAVTFGTVQLLPTGQLIILMADHQTTGGYPRIAHVISAHLPKLAQMNANESFRLALTNIESAEEKLFRQYNYLAQLQKTCKLKMQKLLHA